MHQFILYHKLFSSSVFIYVLYLVFWKHSRVNTTLTYIVEDIALKVQSIFCSIQNSFLSLVYFCILWYKKVPSYVQNSLE